VASWQLYYYYYYYYYYTIAVRSQLGQRVRNTWFHAHTHTHTSCGVGVSVSKEYIHDAILLLSSYKCCRHDYIIFIRLSCVGGQHGNTCGESVYIHIIIYVYRYICVWEKMQYTILLCFNRLPPSLNLQSRLVEKTPERDWDVTPTISRFSSSPPELRPLRDFDFFACA